MMHLYLIRHGESYHNIQEWNTLTSMDTALTDTGWQQVQALADWMQARHMTADVMYHSTLRRTVETADVLSKALKIPSKGDIRIREINSNYLTGLPVEEHNLPRTYNPRRDAFAPRNLELDGAESWMHFRIRLAQFVTMLLEKHRRKTVFLVVHGGVIMGMFDNLFNLGPTRACSVQTANTGWTHFVYEDNAWSLRSHNRVDHLVGTNLAL